MVACREARQLRVLAAAKKAGRSARYSEIERPEAIARERADQQVVQFDTPGRLWKLVRGTPMEARRAKNVWLRLAFAVLHHGDAHACRATHRLGAAATAIMRREPPRIALRVARAGR
jgi:hypothetical protein